MYNFQLQEEMLDISLALLEERGITDPSALGGGTALSAYYWQHRFSTDIDIFIYSDRANVLNKIDPRKTSPDIKARLSKINYTDDLKKHPIYTELAIDDDSKMQFFTVKGFTSTPHSKVTLWGKTILIESIEEIIAKKIFYRCGDANSRDLFDIAVAIHKDPTILMSINVEKEKIEILMNSVGTISENEDLMNTYREDIGMISPAAEYIDIAENAIIYLEKFLSNYLGGLDINIQDMDQYCEELKRHSYSVDN